APGAQSLGAAGTLLEEAAVQLEQLQRDDADTGVRLEELLRQPLAGPDVHRRPRQGLRARAAPQVTGGDENRDVGRLVLEIAAVVLDGATVHRAIPAVDADRPPQLEASVLAAGGEQRTVVAALGDLDLPEMDPVQHLHACLLKGSLLERG